MSIKLRDNKALQTLLNRNPYLSVEGELQGEEPETTKKEKTLCDGMLFDSPGEAARYRHLKLLQQAGLIRRLTTQHEDIGKPQAQRRHRWCLNDRYTKNGKTIRAIYYVDDFQYEAHINGEWITVIEDYKGYARPIFKQKRKILEGKYNIHFFVSTSITDWYDPGSQ